MDPIEEASEIKETVYGFSEWPSQPVHRMQVIHQSGWYKNSVIRIMPAFNRNKYETNVTSVDSAVNFIFQYVR